MNLSLFDLHCDTALEMLRNKQSFFQNTLAVSLQKASVYQRYVQVMTHWTPYRLGDVEGWELVQKMLQNLKGFPVLTVGSQPLGDPTQMEPCEAG